EPLILVSFGGQVTIVDVTLPYSQLNQTLLSGNNFVDEKLIAKWKDLGLTPSPLCSDEEFFRRIHLDVIGTLPSPADIKAFLEDKDTNKRNRAIDKVLARPEFVDFGALKWGDLLSINRTQLNEEGMWRFYTWIATALREDKPEVKFVRDVITDEGS